jgi:hypothetical protein
VLRSGARTPGLHLATSSADQSDDILHPPAFRSVWRGLNGRVSEESLCCKQRAPWAGLTESEPAPRRHPTWSRGGPGGRGPDHLLGVGKYVGSGGGADGPSALIPLGGKNRTRGWRLPRVRSSDGAFFVGQRSVTGSGAGTLETVPTGHLFLWKKVKQTIQGYSPLPGAPAVGE